MTVSDVPNFHCCPYWSGGIRPVYHCLPCPCTKAVHRAVRRRSRAFAETLKPKRKQDTSAVRIPSFLLPFLPNSREFIGMLGNAMSTVKMQIQPSQGVGARYWIFSPVQDIVFVLFTPLLILGAFAAARRGGWMNGLLAFALALATAHYLPGVLRAYGDRALFRRFQVRLILAPLFLFTVTAAFAYLNLHVVLLLALLWGQWHWMMQVYGFARIYDAKARPEARTPAWLDRTMCLMWFGMCVFVLNIDLPSYVTSFYESGGPIIPAQAFVWFTRGWLAATIVVTVIYV